MIKEKATASRKTKQVALTTQFAVVGGGLSGVCAAITAARSGIKVVLLQDRPVLGGNASSEVRLWSLGATSHMGNNNRWSREGGLINEILLDNLKRNKEGNLLIFDTILLEKVYNEENITLILNTAVYQVDKTGDTKIASVTGFCSQNSTTYTVSAPIFCDASGDGIVAFMAGASFRMGAEDKEEFDEGFAPNINDYGNLLGHSLYFYTKNTDKPVAYTPPSFAITNANELPRIKNYTLGDHGCQLWWVEYGGRLDTIHQSEDIKFQLWKVVYGIWDYIKNSGEFPEAANQTLEWVGTIPGKRESRRFEGDFMLSQKDVVAQRDYEDAVTIGGWALDLHPADGVYSKHSSCTQWHSKGVYTIPYRSYYAKDLDNLFLAGRIISATHVAFGSSRVMLTCAHGGQAVGKAAALSLEKKCTPKEIYTKGYVAELQLRLNRDGQGIPRVAIVDKDDKIQSAQLKASSTLQLQGFRPNSEWQHLIFSTAQLLPLQANTLYNFSITVDALEKTVLHVVFKISGSTKHFTPDVIVEEQQISLEKGQQCIHFSNLNKLPDATYTYLCFMKNDKVRLQLSDDRITGVMTVQNKINKAVSNYGRQDPPAGIAIDSFEFWTPERRPKGKNLALSWDKALRVFETRNLKDVSNRPEPTGETHAWVASWEDEQPQVTISWPSPEKIHELRLYFDCDYDHALESVLMQHPESEIPFVVSDYTIFDGNGNLLKKVAGNHQGMNIHIWKSGITTDTLVIKFKQSNATIPVSLFKIWAR
ncbi:FAD-dependent oxidoreductase [Flavobacterium sp. ASW18X]|uniref:FAD-dependent oxidoreductase n=1 Tax=Flavobacterium sp. ASW18X TaxID=2572595 RepID=UPI0010AE27AF|nr:FAD-dependent oxidoreductase [Flavobacterium sp. ASW18X]TKD57920.1 FAD-dependent oxidoreductase [Flavobacterium sp. ASW18X]